MIKVTKIAGESFDFETKQETPKAIVLSNGVRELSLFVDDEIARAVLEMMLETLPAEKPAGGNGRSPANTKPQSPKPAPKKPTAPARAPEPPPMATVGDEAEPEVDDNSGFEPGEEYNDSATGAESL